MWNKEHYLTLVGLQCVHKNTNPLYMNLYTCTSKTQWNAVYTQREKLNTTEYPDIGTHTRGF